MTDEKEQKPEEAVEQGGEEENEEEIDGESLAQQQEGGSPEPPKDEYCDPATMDCKKMPSEMKKLMTRSMTLDEGITTLEKMHDFLPADEIESAHQRTIFEKERIDDNIRKIVDRFSLCQVPSKETEAEAKKSETRGES